MKNITTSLFRIINFVQFSIVPARRRRRWRRREGRGRGRRFIATRCAAARRAANLHDCFETKVNLIYRLIIARAKFWIKLVIGFRLIRRNCTKPPFHPLLRSLSLSLSRHPSPSYCETFYVISYIDVYVYVYWYARKENLTRPSHRRSYRMPN